MPRGYHRYTEIDRAEMVRLYEEEGIGAPEIAERMNCGSTTVYRALWNAGIEPEQRARAGLTKGNRSLTPEQELMAIEEYLSGKSLEAVGDGFGVSLVTVRNILKRHRIDTRRAGNSRREWSPEQIEDIIERYRFNGESQDRIANTYGTSQTIISRILRKHDPDYGQIPSVRFKSRVPAGGGYFYIMPGKDETSWTMRNSAGYVLEHRHVMAEHIGRPLHEWETIHHKDGDRGNNSLDNLQLRINNHGKGVALQCGQCGSTHLEPLEI